MRGATIDFVTRFARNWISIHAPLAGCDCPRRSGVHHRGYFNPRTPCGVRRRSKPTRPTLANFNPRTPCGVRRHGFEIIGQQGGISIHAPLAGCDQGAEDSAAVAKISIHAPLAGCDNAFWSGFSHGGRFQSTHPLRGATFSRQPEFKIEIFQSTHPLRGAT